MSEWGVFAVDRGIWTDPDFASEPFTEREAFMWLVSGAAWKEIRLGFRGMTVRLDRSEFCFSIRFLAEKFKWSKSKVARFLDKLEKRDTIRDTSRDGATIYKIKNYNRFQRVGLPERDTKRDASRDDVGTVAGQQRDKEETFKHSKQEEDDHHTRAQSVLTRVCEILRLKLEADPSRITWHRQVEEMLRDGLTEAQIIAATEKARANGRPSLAYIRAIAFNPPKEQPNEPGNRGRTSKSLDATWRGVGDFVGEDREDARDDPDRAEKPPAAVPAHRQIATGNDGAANLQGGVGPPPGPTRSGLRVAAIERGGDESEVPTVLRGFRSSA